MIADTNRLISVPRNLLEEVLIAGAGYRYFAQADCHDQFFANFFNIAADIKNMRVEDNCRAGANVDSGEFFIFIIESEEIDFSFIDIQISKNISPEKIMFVFPYAKKIVIQRSGSRYLHNAQQTGYGIPGTILAANADIHFMNGLLTGNLYAFNVFASSNKTGVHGNGGQINYAKFKYWKQLFHEIDLLIGYPRDPNSPIDPYDPLPLPGK